MCVIEKERDMIDRKLVRTIIMVGIVAMLIAPLAAFAAGSKEEAYPTRPISVTVPYNPGGSTDLTARALAAPMSKALGVNITVNNTPGAGGAAGSNVVANAPLDGYTLLANGMLAFSSMPVLGTSTKTFREWDIWLATFTPNIIAVRADSPYKTMNDLLADLKARPGSVTDGTAGPGSGGHIGAEVLRAAAKIEYKHVSYPGGAPAILAMLAGEVDFTTQLLVEMEDMIKAGKIRALACYSKDDIQIVGGPLIPSISKFVPAAASYLPMGETTGIAVPVGLSADKLAKLDAAFDTAVKSQEFIDFCKSKGFIINPMGRKASQPYVENLASAVSWILFDAGVAKVSPEQFSIKRK
jgi:tripartite-type tricarboxylate transporter receptor subunit TctC